MQLLAHDSEEGTLQGLGLIPGHVRRFRFDGENAKLKVPTWDGIVYSPHVNIA